MKFLIALDSYKNCICSLDAAECVKKGIVEANSSNIVEIIPLADGGEGTVQAVSFNNENIILESIKTFDALKRVQISEYANFKNSQKAFIELANICGIELLKSSELNIMQATSFGLGVAIKKVIESGKKEIFVGIGSSASCDAGIGMLQGLGARFFDNQNNLIPDGIGGEMLSQIQSFDFSSLEKLIKDTKFTICCDVTNPLTGKNGSSEIFGPQKGATAQMIKILDANLTHIFELFKEKNYCSNCEGSGDGAAGGLGFSFRNILNAELVSGGELILKLGNFSKFVVDADCVITGEGCSDKQTINGKLPLIVAKKAKELNPKIKTILLSGTIKDSKILSDNFDAVFSICSGPMTLEKALEMSQENLYLYGKNIAKIQRP